VISILITSVEEALNIAKMMRLANIILVISLAFAGKSMIVHEV